MKTGGLDHVWKVSRSLPSVGLRSKRMFRERMIVGVLAQALSPTMSILSVSPFVCVFLDFATRTLILAITVDTTQPATHGNQPEHVLPCESAPQQHIWSADPRVSHDNVQGHPGGLPGPYHENTASTGIQPPSPESSSVAGHSIVQPAQRGEIAPLVSTAVLAKLTQSKR